MNGLVWLALGFGLLVLNRKVQQLEDHRNVGFRAISDLNLQINGTKETRVLH